MNEKKIKELCGRIFGFFDDLNNQYDETEFPFSNGFSYYEWMKAKKFDDKMQEEAADILYDVRKVFFAVGYVIGQSFEMGYPEAKKDVEALKKIIREKALLPYFPREKKAA